MIVTCNDCGSEVDEDDAFAHGPQDDSGDIDSYLCASCQHCKDKETIDFLRKENTRLKTELKGRETWKLQATA